MRANAPAADSATIASLLQLTVDNPKLASYFHENDIPARAPLVIVLGDSLRGNYDVSKFGRPVTFKTDAALAKDEPFLEVTSITVGGDTGRIAFRYPPEGIKGTMNFLRRPGEGWAVATTDIVEQ
jgi:hypothetical protein